jgi:hypothetical protein
VRFTNFLRFLAIRRICEGVDGAKNLPNESGSPRATLSRR